MKLKAEPKLTYIPCCTWCHKKIQDIEIVCAKCAEYVIESIKRNIPVTEKTIEYDDD